MATDKIRQYYTSLVNKTLSTAQMSLQISTLTDSQIHDLIKANERYLAECQRTARELVPRDESSSALWLALVEDHDLEKGLI